MTATIPGVGTEVEVKAALKDVVTKLDEGLALAVKVDGANVEVSQENADEIKRLYDQSCQIKGILDMYAAVRDGRKITSVDTEPMRDSSALDASVKSILENGRELSLGQVFTKSDEFKEFKEAGGSTGGSMRTPMALEVFDLPSMGRKDVYGTMAPSTITRQFGTIQFDPMVPRGQRRARVRDLFPVATTTANLIDFFQVLGFVENNAGTGNNATLSGGSGAAASVPDYVTGSPGTFGLKPHSNLQFRSQQAPIRTVAHWEAAHRNVIDDEPQLQATINNELLYGLALVEDYQILKGSGANQELLGIMNTQYIQTYTPSSGTELRSDSLRRAATLSVIANYPSTGYVVHPNDWQEVELTKAASGAGGNDQQYSLVTNVAVGAQAQMWRNPVIETPVIDEGTFLTGAFGTGAQLYDRQVANVRIADQHADFFLRNAVVVLCEERLGLAVKRPESFIKGLFGALRTSGFPADEDSNPAT